MEDPPEIQPSVREALLRACWRAWLVCGGSPVLQAAAASSGKNSYNVNQELSVACAQRDQEQVNGKTAVPAASARQRDTSGRGSCICEVISPLFLLIVIAIRQTDDRHQLCCSRHKQCTGSSEPAYPTSRQKGENTPVMEKVVSNSSGC